MTFADYFQRATGHEPYPYQATLAQADLTRRALAAPTGAGKTAAAVLAWLWQRHTRPASTSLRLIWCLPGRTLLEPLYDTIQHWLGNLDLQGTVGLHTVEGGYEDKEWELRPEQPAVLIGTQDQLLSRALNRGYAMSRFRWPIHFGLFHNDAQWVFDEVQLMGPGLATSAQLHGLRSQAHFGPVGTLWMSTTLRTEWLSTIDHPSHDLEIHPFESGDRERLAGRLQAAKPLFKAPLKLDRTSKKTYGKALAAQILDLHQPGQFTLVILNTPERARELFKRLEKAVPDQALFLLHSRLRGGDRGPTLERALDPGLEDKIVIATQVLEGVDISADRLVCELAPEASLIQRFGRCNRSGEQGHAQVHWIDVDGDESITAPYRPPDLQRARARLQDLDSVEPAQFIEVVGEGPPVYDTLRRSDLMGLFDTAGDLGGMDLDVGRFIDGGRDVYCYWREWTETEPPADSPAPHSAELCKVDLSQVRDHIAEKPDLWMRDTLQGHVGEWRRARFADLVPGRTFAIHSAQGLYHPQYGWDPESAASVAPLTRLKFPFPTIIADRLSMEATENLILAEHTEQVREELDSLMRGLNTLSAELQHTLRQVGLWHDVGKAHETFQKSMTSYNKSTQRGVLYAKREGSDIHRRRYFRHELAGALAALEHGLDFLTVYLIASHHGKARVSIRAFPDEDYGAIMGIRNGAALPEMTLGELELPATTLSLRPFSLGRGSWHEQALRLIEEHGPFRLAYLEALVRAADERASRDR